jgi:ubiquinone/menaquinone biosynthesis C-methylase UbiE
MTKEKFKEYYREGQVTKGYDKQREGTDYRRRKRKEEVELFLYLLDKKRGEKVLEIGCSSGRLTRHLGNVTAIDTSKNMLKIAKRKNPKAKVVEADMFNLPFKNQSLDKVVIMRVWNHLNMEDLYSVLREARRVLKRRGVVVFDVEEENVIRKIVNFFYKKIFRIKGFKVYQYSLEKISLILMAVDFDVEEVKYLRHRVGRQIILRARKL